MSEELKRNNELLEKLISKNSLFNRFIGGFFQALGATLGLAAFITIASYFLSQIELVPILGKFISEVINNAISNVDTTLYQ